MDAPQLLAKLGLNWAVKMVLRNLRTLATSLPTIIRAEFFIFVLLGSDSPLDRTGKLKTKRFKVGRGRIAEGEKKRKDYYRRRAFSLCQKREKERVYDTNCLVVVRMLCNRFSFMFISLDCKVAKRRRVRRIAQIGIKSIEKMSIVVAIVLRHIVCLAQVISCLKGVPRYPRWVGIIDELIRYCICLEDFEFIW